MLKAVIVDSNAISRGLLNTVLTEGGYDVVAQTHTALLGLVQVQKHHPQIFCIGREQVEDGHNVVEQIRAAHPKTLIFMMTGTMDAALMQASLARGVQGFIVKPFKADAVLNTIRNTVMAVIKRQKTSS
ncbi:MAG TPA: response regulator [Telluria sp.]|jgi:two-component system chemotaxis response regulator CheY